MEIRDFIRLLRKRKWSGLLFLIVTLVGTAAITDLTPVRYTSTSRVFVAVSDANQDISAALTGSNFTLQRVKSYSQLIKTPSVLEPASESLGFKINADDVSAKIPLDTVIIEIKATDDDPTKSSRVANAVAEALGEIVVKLETPLSGAMSPVKTQVVEYGEVPISPTQPRPILNFALGILLGLAGAVGIMLLLESLDQKVRTPEDIQELTSAAPMSVLPFDKDAERTPLAALSKRSRRSEGFRRIRTNLQFADVDNPPRAIVITSALPNEGKTTTAINLALTMALGGQRVLLIEADLRRPKIGKYLNIDVALGLTDVLTDRIPLDEAIQSIQHGLLDVLPGGLTPPNPSELLGSGAMHRLVNRVKTGYQTIIIDAPPLLPVSDAAVLAGVADGAVLLTRWGKTKKEEVRASLEQLRVVDARLLGTVVNFAPMGKRGSYYGYGYGYGYSGKYGYASPSSKSEDLPKPGVVS